MLAVVAEQVRWASVWAAIEADAARPGIGAAGKRYFDGGRLSNAKTARGAGPGGLSIGSWGLMEASRIDDVPSKIPSNIPHFIEHPIEHSSATLGDVGLSRSGRSLLGIVSETKGAAGA